MILIDDVLKVIWIDDLEGGNLTEIIKSNQGLISKAEFLVVLDQVDIFTLREYSSSPSQFLLLKNEDNEMIVDADFLKAKNILVFSNELDIKNYLRQQRQPKQSEPIKQKQQRCENMNKQEVELSPKTKPISKVVTQERKRIEFVLPKIPNMFLPKPKTHLDAVKPLNHREVGFIGATHGVGTTFAAYYYSIQCSQQQMVSLVIYNDQEANILSKLEDLPRNLEVYSKDNLREALRNNIIVFDFGMLDRNCNGTLQEFERCSDRYVVSNLTFNKRHSINNVLQYYNETTLPFVALFNFVDDEKLHQIQKTFKDLKCDNLSFTQHLIC